MSGPMMFSTPLSSYVPNFTLPPQINFPPAPVEWYFDLVTQQVMLVPQQPVYYPPLPLMVPQVQPVYTQYTQCLSPPMSLMPSVSPPMSLAGSDISRERTCSLSSLPEIPQVQTMYTQFPSLPSVSHAGSGRERTCSLSSQSSDSENVSSWPYLSRALHTESVPHQNTAMQDFLLFKDGLRTAFIKASRFLKLKTQDLTIHVEPTIGKKKSHVTISWNVNTTAEKFDELSALLEDQTDFEPTLICELASIQNGSFNKYLDGAKQLTIVHMGFEAVHKLKDCIVNPRRLLEPLLKIPYSQRFGEECKNWLYGLCISEEGNALRGPTVVGIRFKQQQDILKMGEFVQEVMEKTCVEQASLIASLKKNDQYKGWSLYLEVGNETAVKTVFEICDEFEFKQKHRYIADDKL